MKTQPTTTISLKNINEDNKQKKNNNNTTTNDFVELPTHEPEADDTKPWWWFGT